MSHPGIDLVAVNYRTSNDLQSFGVSLERYTPQREFTVTVVNVSPEPADTRMGLDVINRFATARVVPIEENVGYGVAANWGADGFVEHEIVCILNVDIAFSEGAIDRVCDVLLSHDDWGLAGPRQVDCNRRITAGGIFGTNVAPAHRAWLQRDDGTCHDIRDDCTVVVGSAMFVKRHVWDELTNCTSYQANAPRPNPIGPLLETPLFYEDAWLSYHARDHGYLCGYVGDAVIEHRWHGSVAAHGGTYKREPAREMFRHSCAEHMIQHD